ncbi:3'(2'),5'-bisphosphate nucleotidase CysQ [Sphingomonas sp.]
MAESLPTIDGLIEAALAGAHAIRAMCVDGRPPASDKPDGSPVTDADRAAETAVLAVLARVAPDVPVVAEEAVAAGHVPDIGERFLLVDALDGTREFARGSNDYTVNVALIASGAPAMGVVVVPATGEVFAGDAEGARRAVFAGSEAGGWTTLAVSAGSGEPRILASRSHMTAETRAYCEAWPRAGYATVGSSLKFARLAEGAADLYPRMGRTMEWDTAAGDAVLRAAGGKVRTLDGAPLTYGKRGQVGEPDFANPWFVAHGGFDPFANGAQA